MEKTVFDFESYKTYLNGRVGGPRQRRGIKSLMAKTHKCQPTYVSQVLNGSADFSSEQAEVLNRFFGHSREESVFFLLLIFLFFSCLPLLLPFFIGFQLEE